MRTGYVSGLRSSFSEPLVMRYHISNEVHCICFHQENLHLNQKYPLLYDSQMKTGAPCNAGFDIS